MNPTDADLATLVTEADDPRYAQLDSMSVADLARVMNDADATVADSVRQALPQIIPAIEAAADCLAAGGRLVYVGAGTAGRIGVLDAAECLPTFNIWPGQVQAIIAGGPPAIVTPVEGAEDDQAAGRADIDAADIGPCDAVLGLASSGRTPYVVAALDRARQRGAVTIGLSGNTDAKLSHVADYAIEVEVGPEVIAGSTRLKAGTAQKLVLNMFSTITMIRLGKTYGNLMVDVRATNHKLRHRACRMVANIAQVSPDQAAATLATVDWDVKVAALMLARSVDAATAADRLAGAGDRLRQALEEA